MPKKWKWIVGLGVVLLFGVIAYSLFEASQHRYEVCVSFRTAIAPPPRDALPRKPFTARTRSTAPCSRWTATITLFAWAFRPPVSAPSPANSSLSRAICCGVEVYLRATASGTGVPRIRR